MTLFDLLLAWILESVAGELRHLAEDLNDLAGLIRLGVKLRGGAR